MDENGSASEDRILQHTPAGSHKHSGNKILQHTPAGSPNHHEPDDRIAIISGRLLERADTIIYSIIGILFLVGALFALGYSVWDFINSAQEALKLQSITAVAVAGVIIEFISDLLLVLIIMEVLSTVIQYLKAHATSLRPFLFIGIISATRSILSIGARLSVGEVPNFTNSMIELGVSAAVVLALGITLRLLGKMVDIDASAGD